MTYQTFRITTVSSSTNAYTTERTETWNIVPDICFSDVENAKNYVIAQNLLHSELSRFLVDFTNEDDKDAFKHQFCFGDNYLHLQRYFLGQPNVKRIREALKANGVSMI